MYKPLNSHPAMAMLITEEIYGHIKELELSVHIQLKELLEDSSHLTYASLGAATAFKTIEQFFEKLQSLVATSILEGTDPKDIA